MEGTDYTNCTVFVTNKNGKESKTTAWAFAAKVCEQAANNNGECIVYLNTRENYTGTEGRIQMCQRKGKDEATAWYTVQRTEIRFEGQGNATAFIACLRAMFAIRGIACANADKRYTEEVQNKCHGIFNFFEAGW